MQGISKVLSLYRIPWDKATGTGILLQLSILLALTSVLCRKSSSSLRYHLEEELLSLLHHTLMNRKVRHLNSSLFPTWELSCLSKSPTASRTQVKTAIFLWTAWGAGHSVQNRSRIQDTAQFCSIMTRVRGISDLPDGTAGMKCPWKGPDPLWLDTLQKI